MIIIVRSIMKNYGSFCRYNIFKITYAVSSTSTFTCIMAIVSNFIFFIFRIFIFKLFFTNITDLCCYFHMTPAHLLVTSFFFFLKLIILTVYSFEDSWNFFMQSLPLYTSCFFSMSLNNSIADIEKPDGIYSPTFVADYFLALFLHPSIFSIRYSRSAWIKNGVLWDF